jgi:hypothetical protein
MPFAITILSLNVNRECFHLSWGWAEPQTLAPSCEHPQPAHKTRILFVILWPPATVSLLKSCETGLDIYLHDDYMYHPNALLPFSFSQGQEHQKWHGNLNLLLEPLGPQRTPKGVDDCRKKFAFQSFVVVVAKFLVSWSTRANNEA